MAINRPKPKELSVEQRQKITAASSMQVVKGGIEKSYDPENFPVFEVPVNDLVLAYVPYIVRENEEGVLEMQWDRFPAHPIKESAKSFSDVRCINGLVVPELGYDGHCPLCDRIGSVWDLFNFEYAQVAAQRGMTVDAPEAKDGLKNERLTLLNDQAIKKADFWLTFPIVVVECEKDKLTRLTNIKKPIIDDNSQLVYKVYWYTIREMGYEEKWKKAVATIDSPAAPAGNWVLLDYTYKPKDGKEPTKMLSAKGLHVTFLNKPDFADWGKFFDELCAGWTPEKAQEVVIKDAVRDMEETQDIADMLGKKIDERLTLYKLGMSSNALPMTVGNPSMEASMKAFNATPVGSPAGAPASPASLPKTTLGEMPTGNTGIQ